MMIDIIVSKNIAIKPENIGIVSMTNFVIIAHHYRNHTERCLSCYIIDIIITQDKGNIVHTLLYIDTVTTTINIFIHIQSYNYIYYFIDMFLNPGHTIAIDAYIALIFC